MRSATVLAILLAVGAIAVPLVERAYLTQYEYVTVTKVVTAGVEPTEVPSNPYGGVDNLIGGVNPRPRPSSSRRVQTPHAQPTTSSYTPALPSSTPPSAISNSPSSGGTTGSVSYPTGNDYKSKCLRHHNVHRTNHSAPALQWDDRLASIANQQASKCVYKHETETGGGGYGQNMAAGVEDADVGIIISDLFYNGEIGKFGDSYGQANPSGDFHGWGHFTQIVWKETSKFGCATVKCSKIIDGESGQPFTNVSPWLTFCNYETPG
ncbi:PR-1-like protein [Patellaria atrata CBS 101060]|uniref:PR-1-like protein n=1 Tax=Patellaria atrata CBS 101060 TaxID=1346257 RepID=A0A9P4VP00_9PEZI|nr:PR-1-like protein [Patellaria atrata CBS 101060]